MVAMVDSGKLKDVTMLEEAKTTPVVRKKKMKGVIGNLFVMPGKVEEKEHKEEEETIATIVERLRLLLAGEKSRTRAGRC